MDISLTHAFQRHRGAPDGIEQFNWYPREWEDINRIPKCLHPFMDEIEEFCNYLTKSVNRRILKLFSRVLELPDDYLWENVQSHGSPTGEGYFRHALFRPVEQSTREKSKGLRMHGHTDFGLTTLLFSVPISCLQIWGQDEKWYYVPYKPGALVINIGDTLEIVSGGHFKATRHRVFTPPADQLHEERLSLVLFNSSVGDLRMTPAACEYNCRYLATNNAEYILTLTLLQLHHLSNGKAVSRNKVSTRNSRGSPSKDSLCPQTASGERCRSRRPQTRRTQSATASARTRSSSTASSCNNENTWVSGLSCRCNNTERMNTWIAKVVVLNLEIVYKDRTALWNSQQSISQTRCASTRVWLNSAIPRYST